MRKEFFATPQSSITVYYLNTQDIFIIPLTNHSLTGLGINLPNFNGHIPVLVMRKILLTARHTWMVLQTRIKISVSS